MATLKANPSMRHAHALQGLSTLKLTASHARVMRAILHDVLAAPQDRLPSDADSLNELQRVLYIEHLIVPRSILGEWKLTTKGIAALNAYDSVKD